jgi:diguanylate cyclase (GGDEF)-like protein/PAS domain S-box-containing protein
MPRAQQPDDRLHTVLRIAQLGFWEMGMPDRSFTLSDEACAILGLEPGREHGMDSLLGIIHPADRDLARAAIDRALRGEAPLDIEHRVVRPSGEVRHVHARGLLTRLGGQPSYLGTVQDITERIARRSEAEQNAMLLQIASRIAHFGGWSYDLASGIVTWSEEVCRIHEVPSGATPTIGEMLGFIAPEWRVKCQELMAVCVRDGVPYDEEVQIITTGGRRVWVRKAGEPVRDARNAIIRLQGAYQDITEGKEAQEQMARTAQRLHATLESITDAFYTLDREWRFTYINREAERLLQRPRGELLGKIVWEEFRPDKSQIGYRELHRALRENVTVVYEEYAERLQILAEVRAYPSEEGLTVYFRDITEARKAAESLRISEERFRTIARSTTDVVWDWDLERDTLWVSDSMERVFGYSAKDFSGPPRGWSGHIHPDDRERVCRHVLAAIEGRDNQWMDEYRLMRKDGSVAVVLDRSYIIRDGAGRAVRMIGAMVDLTEQRQAEHRIEYLAFYDALTQLPNRQLLIDRLRSALAAGAGRRCFNALCFIDLDNFKSLNDTGGHAVGDLLLQQVAHRLSACVSHSDTVARFGGDEYVVLLEQLSEDQEAACAEARAVGERILHAVRQPYKLDNYRHSTTASVGVVLFNDGKDDSGELLKRADMAMYQAKAAGRNTLCFFNPHMEAALSARMALEADLRHALRDCEQAFDLYYQPQVDQHGRIIGVEALVRWRHPERGTVQPVEFIPLAEETGLVLSLGEWVLRKACQQLVNWAASPETANLEIAVNVSARQFHHPGFVAQVLGALGPVGADAHRLKLELTETSVLENVDDSIAKMNLLKTKGVTFALDDFGTGYSSLAYLKQLPLDMLKIDRSFVMDLLTNPNDAAIARTIISLGRTLGLRVLAEGVETPAQRDFLFAHGCESYQGFLCSRPLPAADLTAIVGAPA